MVYLDTSVVIASVLHEQRSEEARHILARPPSSGLLTSGWVQTEMISGLAIKWRAGVITIDHRHQAARELEHVLHTLFTMAPIEHRHFQLAADFVDRDVANLRGADALHLAIVATWGATLYTFDKVMADAAKVLGILLWQGE